MSPLDLTAIRRANAQLREGIAAAEKDPENAVIRDGVIQRFAYSHELAMKFMKRALETRHSDPVDQFSHNELLRTAAERGYITDVEAWFQYRNSRNQTSHTYDGNIAALVFAQAKPFLASAEILLKNLAARND
jgi:nucleotidyltransferase substrate binding protein (TIGR01987 family)